MKLLTKMLSYGFNVTLRFSLEDFFINFLFLGYDK